MVSGKRGRNKKETPVVSFRLPKELLGHIDEHAKRLSEERHGVEVTRIQALKELIRFALYKWPLPKEGED